MPRILYIVPSDYDALKSKGVDGMIFDRDEHGFFERVVTVHPASHRSRAINFNDVFTLHEVGLDIFGRSIQNRILMVLVSPMQFARALLTILKLIRKERIDLIRANDPFWMGLMGLAAARLTGRPLCVSIHTDYDKREQLTGGGNSYTLFGMRWPARMICRWVLSSADMIMPIRESLKDWAISNGATPDRIRVIPHGIDVTAFDETAEVDFHGQFDISADRKIISFTGRICKENYFDDVIEIGHRLASQRDDFCLVVAGAGGLEDKLRKAMHDDMRLKRTIRFIGSQPRPACFAMRKKSTVSLCLMGGFSLIEACLAASPAISYDVEWHNELVKNGLTGFLVKENNIDGAVEAINFLLDHEKEAYEMGQRARRLAIERHNMAACSKIKRSCYKELLSRAKTNKIRSRNPEEEILKGNPWYTDDQIAAQLSTSGRRKIIENRWNVFQQMIQDWLKERESSYPDKYFKMLDAGCGDGINLIGICKKAKEKKWMIEMTGVDHNPVRVSRALQQGQGVNIHQASLYDLPFKNGTFDIVLCNQVLEHISDLSRSLSELHRVLKTGGLFIAGIPNEGCLMAQLRNNIVQRGILRKTDHVNFFTRESFIHEVSKLSFIVRKVETETFFFPVSYINMFLNESKSGHALMSVLRAIFPNQAGGIIVACEKYKDPAKSRNVISQTGDHER